MGSRNGNFFLNSLYIFDSVRIICKIRLLLLNNKIERLLMVPNIFVSVVDYTIFVYSKKSFKPQYYETDEEKSFNTCQER